MELIEVVKAPGLVSIPSCKKIEITFLSPLRLKHQGKLLRPEAFTAEIWLKQLIWRVSLLLKDSSVELPKEDISCLLKQLSQISFYDAELFWMETGRRSSRQNTKMSMGGILGRFFLEGELEPILPWLELGMTLHVGKSASMGFGAFGVKSL